MSYRKSTFCNDNSKTFFFFPLDKTGQKIFAVTVRECLCKANTLRFHRCASLFQCWAKEGSFIPQDCSHQSHTTPLPPRAGSHHRGVTSSGSTFQFVDSLHFPAICMCAFLFLESQISKIGSHLVLTFQNLSALFLCGRPGCDNAPQGWLEMACLPSKPPPQQPFRGFEGNM